MNLRDRLNNDALYAVLVRIFGGTTIYVPKAGDEESTEDRDRRIVESHTINVTPSRAGGNGMSYRQSVRVLARQEGRAESTIRGIIWKARMGG